jgi:hypothetical protein
VETAGDSSEQGERARRGRGGLGGRTSWAGCGKGVERSEILRGGWHRGAGGFFLKRGRFVMRHFPAAAGTQLRVRESVREDADIELAGRERFLFGKLLYS